MYGRALESKLLRSRTDRASVSKETADGGRYSFDAIGTELWALLLATPLVYH